MTLQELITESRAKRALRGTEETERRRNEENRVRQLFDQVMADAIARHAVNVPEPLRQYIAYAGEALDEESLRRYKTQFDPCDFKIAGAPSLVTINFSAAGKIFIGDETFSDWIEAVARAADLAEQPIETKA